MMILQVAGKVHPKSPQYLSQTFIALIVFSILLITPSYSSFSQKYGGACEKRCEERRPKGYDKSFRFNCDDIKDEEEIKKCRETCEQCPKEVCDETLSEGSDKKWHCPATTLTGKCEVTCRENRPLGKRENYTFDIPGAQRKSDDESECLKNCASSPFVCENEASQRMRYHCPYEDISSDCRLECDNVRLQNAGNLSYLRPFVFRCDERYSKDSNARSLCWQRCQKKCPKWVCDWSVDPNTYHCPSAQLVDGECKTLCNRYRDHEPDPKDAYEHFCGSPGETLGDCKRQCLTCSSPQDVNFVCPYLEDPQHFYCPPFEEDNPIPRKKRSFKGTCKDRCEINRGGGFRAYVLNCEARYKTTEEQDLCKQDCTECPFDVCDETVDKNIIKCPGVESELKKEQEAIEEEREKETEEKTTFLIVLGVSFFVFLMVAVGAVLYTVRKYQLRTGMSGGCFGEKKNSEMTITNQEEEPPGDPASGEPEEVKPNPEKTRTAVKLATDQSAVQQAKKSVAP